MGKSNKANHSLQLGLFQGDSAIEITAERFAEHQKRHAQLKLVLYAVIAQKRFERLYCATKEGQAQLHYLSKASPATTVAIEVEGTQIDTTLDQNNHPTNASIAYPLVAWEALSDRRKREIENGFEASYDHDSETLTFAEPLQAMRFAYEQEQPRLYAKLRAECSQVAHESTQEFLLLGKGEEAAQRKLAQDLPKLLKKSRHPFIQELKAGKPTKEWKAEIEDLSEAALQVLEQEAQQGSQISVKTQQRVDHKNKTKTKKHEQPKRRTIPTSLGSVSSQRNDSETTSSSQGKTPSRHVEGLSTTENPSSATGNGGNDEALPKNEPTRSGGNNHAGTPKPTPANKSGTRGQKTGERVSARSGGGTRDRSGTRPKSSDRLDTVAKPLLGEAETESLARKLFSTNGADVELGVIMLSGLLQSHQVAPTTLQEWQEALVVHHKTLVEGYLPDFFEEAKEPVQGLVPSDEIIAAEVEEDAETTPSEEKTIHESEPKVGGTKEEETTVTQEIADPAPTPTPKNTTPRYSSPNNFHISEEVAMLPQGGKVAKLNANMNAFLLLQALAKEERSPTKVEKQALVQYSSWGALGNDYLTPAGDSFVRNKGTFVAEILPIIISGGKYTIPAEHYYLYKPGAAAIKGDLRPLDYRYVADTSIAFLPYKGSETDFAALTEHVKQSLEKLPAFEQNLMYSYVNGLGYVDGNNLGSIDAIDLQQIRQGLVENLLDKNTYQKARESTLSGHYTDRRVIAPIWEILEEQLGFEGGKLGELSAGVGHFMGLMPKHLMEQSAWVALEPDGIASQIASYLYPDAQIHQTGIEKYVPATEDLLDVAITNVPFGASHITPYDEYQPHLSKFSLHNYCLAKNIQNLKEAGVLLAISSSSTLDSAVSKNFREWVIGEGDTDFMGAIRLPQNTFEKSAGTQVTTDILLFRKREKGQKHPLAQDFMDTGLLREGVAYANKSKNVAPAAIEVNEYYIKHPENIIGEMFLAHETDHGLYDPNEQTCAWYSKEDYAARIMKFEEKLASTGEATVTAEQRAQYEAYCELYELLAERAPDTRQELNLSKAIREAASASFPAKLLSREQTKEISQGKETVPNQGAVNLEHISPVWKYNPATKQLLLRKQQRGQWHDMPVIDVPAQVNTLVKQKGKVVKDAPVEVVRAYVRLGQSFMRVNELENRCDPNNEDDEQELDDARLTLNEHYDAFVQRYGAINQAGKRLSFLKRNAPGFAMVKALEKRVVLPLEPGKTRPKFHYEKADIMHQRTAYPVIVPEKATNIDDALKLSLIYQGGSIDLEYMASLLAQEEEQVKDTLLAGLLAYQNPVTRKLETPEKYLSGSVRSKLKVAKKHAEEDPMYEANVSALEVALPDMIPFEDIGCNLGAGFIPAKVIEAFISDRLDLIAKITYIKSSGKWVVDVKRGDVDTSAYGTSRVNAIDLLKASLDLKSVVVKDTETDVNGKDKRVKNEEETAFAATKKVELEQAFKSWLRERTEFHAEIEQIYNETHNGEVSTNWQVPEIEHYPATNHQVIIRDHQKSAVARNLVECTMNAHEPGAGKTFIIIVLAMESKRLNPKSKTMIVVQNQTLEQFVESFHYLYPGANILAPTKKDYSKENRQQLLTQIATNNYDAVIVPQSQIDMIADNENRVKAYIQQEVEDAYRQLRQMDDRDSREAKNLESFIKQMRDTEQKLNKKGIERLVDGEELAKDHSTKDKVRAELSTGARIRAQMQRKTDDILTFEQLGIDRLLVDEAHAYKKLGFASQMTGVKGIDMTGSKRAMSMFLKVRHIQEKNGGVGVSFFTGTPITNTPAELWTWVKYLQPKLLAKRGIARFDAFAQVHGDIKDYFEQTPAGSFKEVSRFAAYDNVPELNTLWKAVADVVLTEDIREFKEQKEFVVGKSVPSLRGNRYQMHLIPASPFQENIRREFIRVLNQFEGMSAREKKAYSYYPLVVYGQATRATIDPRLLKGANNYSAGGIYRDYLVDIDDPLSKANQAIEEVARLYNDSKERKGTQLIFCDKYKSSDESFNLFHDIKRKLVAQHGIAEEEIVVITDKEYEKDFNRQSLFEKVQQGKVRVMLGSTEKMGVGVNVQDKLVGLHHLDAPIRPSDFEQRNRRILRQGNENPEIEIHTYGIKGSMDLVMYQMLETKAHFIKQIMKADSVHRKLKDEGAGEDQDTGDLFASMKANLSDNPLLMMHLRLKKDKARAEGELKALSEQIKKSRERLGEKKDSIATLTKAIAAYEVYVDRLEQRLENEALRKLTPAQLAKVRDIEIADYKGHPLRIEVIPEEVIGIEEDLGALWRLGRGKFSQRIEIKITDAKGKAVSPQRRKKMAEKEEFLNVQAIDKNTGRAVAAWQNDYERGLLELKQLARETVFTSALNEGHMIAPEILKNEKWSSEAAKEQIKKLNQVARKAGKHPLVLPRKEAEGFLSDYLKQREHKVQNELGIELATGATQKSKKVPSSFFISPAELKINGVDFQLKMGYKLSSNAYNPNYSVQVAGFADKIAFDEYYALVPEGLHELSQEFAHAKGHALLAKFESSVSRASTILAAKRADLAKNEDGIAKLEELVSDKEALNRAEEELEDLTAELAALEAEMIRDSTGESLMAFNLEDSQQEKGVVDRLRLKQENEALTGEVSASTEEAIPLTKEERAKVLDYSWANSAKLSKVEKLLIHYLLNQGGIEDAQGNRVLKGNAATLTLSQSSLKIDNETSLPLIRLHYSHQDLPDKNFELQLLAANTGECQLFAELYPYALKKQTGAEEHYYNLRTEEQVLMPNALHQLGQMEVVQHLLPQELNPYRLLEGLPVMKQDFDAFLMETTAKEDGLKEAKENEQKAQRKERLAEIKQRLKEEKAQKQKTNERIVVYGKPVASKEADLLVWLIGQAQANNADKPWAKFTQADGNYLSVQKSGRIAQELLPEDMQEFVFEIGKANDDENTFEFACLFDQTNKRCYVSYFSDEAKGVYEEFYAKKNPPEVGLMLRNDNAQEIQQAFTTQQLPKIGKYLATKHQLTTEQKQATEVAGKAVESKPVAKNNLPTPKTPPTNAAHQQNVGLSN